MAKVSAAARLRLPAAYAAAWICAAAPLLSLAWRAWHGALTANPIEFLEHDSGDWALRLLLVTLAMTPLRRLSGWPEPLRIRRTLGLWAYAWLCLHFAAYLVFDLQFSLLQLGTDLVKRTYITLGFAAWLLMLPLAITSTNGWQRRLKRRWKTLHRLVYPAAILGVLHYIWLVKRDLSDPLLYAGLLALLFALRLPWPWRRAARQTAKSAPRSTGARDAA